MNDCLPVEQPREMPLNMLAWAPPPLECSANPQNSPGGWLLLQSLGFCVARMESSGSLPCHLRRLGLTTSWEFEEKKFGFFSRKQFPQQSTSLYQRSAVSYSGVGPAFQEQNPALLPPLGKTGPHLDGTMPSANHPETGLAGNRVEGEEGRAV